MITNKLILGLLTAALLQGPCYSFSVAGIKAENFVQLVTNSSQYSRITGKICGCKISKDSKVIFLNFGKNFNTSLSALIYNFDMPAFIDAGIEEPEKFFTGKKVVIEGVIRINSGKPEVVLNSPSQIKLMQE